MVGMTLLLNLVVPMSAVRIEAVRIETGGLSGGRARRFRPARALVAAVLAAVVAIVAAPAPAWAAAPAFVQVNSVSTTAATVTVPIGGTTAGNLLVVYLDWSNTGTASITDNKGDTFTAAAAAVPVTGSGRSQVFYARNVAAGVTSVTATFSASVVADVYVAEYSGLDPVNPLDGTTAATGSSTAPNSGSISTTTANDVLFGAGAMFGGTPSAPGSGYTFRSTAAQNVVEDRTVTATGTYSASATLSPGSGWVMHVVAFRAAQRDPLKQPFASTSIWNMPIGTGAQYAPANLPADPRNDPWAPMPQNDVDTIVFTPTAPATNVYYSSAGWNGQNRCVKTGNQLLYSAPIPAGYVVLNDTANEGAGLLMADKRTITMSVPFTRCTSGGYATSLVSATSIDLYGNGLGGLGGSNLAANPGGVLRLGELRPGGQGPRHALRIDIDAGADLFACQVKTDCYRWPATTADSYALDPQSGYGRYNNNQNTPMKMGALLAIPATVSISGLGLETDPGRQLAWTLQNYGAYVTDDSGGGGFDIVTEHGPAGWFGDMAEGSNPNAPALSSTQFYQDYGYAFEQRVNSNTPWSRDMQRLNTALTIVTNNGPSSIGGGGTPLQPLAPPIAPPP